MLGVGTSVTCRWRLVRRASERARSGTDHPVDPGNGTIAFARARRHPRRSHRRSCRHVAADPTRDGLCRAGRGAGGDGSLHHGVGADRLCPVRTVAVAHARARLVARPAHRRCDRARGCRRRPRTGRRHSRDVGSAHGGGVSRRRHGPARHLGRVALAAGAGRLSQRSRDRDGGQPAPQAARLDSRRRHHAGGRCRRGRGRSGRAPPMPPPLPSASSVSP